MKTACRAALAWAVVCATALVACLAVTGCGSGSTTPKQCPHSQGVLNSNSAGEQVWSNTAGVYWIWGNRMQPTTTYYTDPTTWDSYEHDGNNWYSHLSTYPSPDYTVDAVRKPLGVSSSDLASMMASGKCEAAPAQVTATEQHRASATLVISATDYGTDSALFARRHAAPVYVIAGNVAGVSLADITAAVQGAPGPQFHYVDSVYHAGDCSDVARCPFLELAQYAGDNQDAAEFFAAAGATQPVAGCSVDGWKVTRSSDPSGFIASKAGVSVAVTGNLADDSTASGNIQPLSQCATIVRALGQATAS